MGSGVLSMNLHQSPPYLWSKGWQTIVCSGFQSPGFQLWLHHHLPVAWTRNLTATNLRSSSAKRD